jgi:aconitate hydratase
MAGIDAGQTVTVTATSSNGKTITFKTKARIDTPNEVEYYRHGGILAYVLRQIAKQA